MSDDKLLPSEIKKDLHTLYHWKTSDQSSPVTRSQLILAFKSLATYFLIAGDRERKQLIDALTDESDTLFSLAWTCAIQSVHHNSAEWIQVGIIAIILENLERDWRETLRYSCLLGHSARKIGLQLDSIFRYISIDKTNKCTALLQSYFEQTLENQSIELMGFREGSNEHGFTYTPLSYDEMI